MLSACKGTKKNAILRHIYKKSTKKNKAVALHEQRLISFSLGKRFFG